MQSTAVIGRRSPLAKATLALSSVTCARVYRTPQVTRLSHKYFVIIYTAIASHTQAVAKITSDTQRVDAVTHGRVGDLTTKAGHNRR